MLESEAVTAEQQHRPEPERDPGPEPDEQQLPAGRRRRVWIVVGGVVVLAIGGASAVYVTQDGGGKPARQVSKLPTATVVRTDMVNTTEVDGTMGYAGKRTVLAEGSGRITWLPGVGSVLGRGDRVYGLNGHSVPLFYGSTPLWRELRTGMTDGDDVLVLERNLTALGYGSYLSVDRHFSAATASVVKDWQDDLGVKETGVVKLGDVVVQAGEIRVTKLDAVLGAPASGVVLTASGTERRITVDLPVSDQDLARKGAKVRVKLPGGKTAEGRVSAVGKVADAGDTNSKSQTGEGTQNATVPVYITLTGKRSAASLDGSPATVGFASTEHKNVLAVPVNALLAKANGNYVVKVVNAAGKVRTVPVELGIFQGDKVEVKGALSAGMKVQVPSS
jgi:peptidoglycan hydrolase-like protein with peptidoglycan-binding domain